MDGNRFLFLSGREVCLFVADLKAFAREKKVCGGVALWYDGENRVAVLSVPQIIR